MVSRLDGVSRVFQLYVDERMEGKVATAEEYKLLINEARTFDNYLEYATHKSVKDVLFVLKHYVFRQMEEIERTRSLSGFEMSVTYTMYLRKIQLNIFRYMYMVARDMDEDDELYAYAILESLKWRLSRAFDYDSTECEWIIRCPIFWKLRNRLLIRECEIQKRYQREIEEKIRQAKLKALREGKATPNPKRILNDEE